VTSAAFSRADFVAVMGGIEADLRPAATAGGTAVIEVFVLMGGIEITVPPDWAVVNRAAVVMGGVTDHSSGAQGAAHTLYIQGVVLMGGVEIKT
jgi:predicted membrane protein